MRECIKCGASLYRDADPFCEHDFGEAPEPDVVHIGADASVLWVGPVPEQLYGAGGVIAGQHHVAHHPTREGAVALWKERWRWAPAIQALFGWLLGRPSAWGPVFERIDAEPPPRSDGPPPWHNGGGFIAPERLMKHDELAAAIDREIERFYLGDLAGTVSDEEAIEQTVEGALEILRETGGATVTSGGRRFEVSIVSAFNAAFAVRWVTPGPNGELHAVVCVGWRELTDTLRDAVAGRGVFAPPSQPLVPAPTVEQVKLARVLANLREHGRARFMALLATDGRYYEYSVERYSTGRSGYSIERHGHPGLLRFSGAEVPTPLIDAINTALSGGDPFASADGDEAFQGLFRGVARAHMTERALRKHADAILGRHAPQLLDEPDHGGRTVTVNQPVESGQAITADMVAPPIDHRAEMDCRRHHPVPLDTAAADGRLWHRGERCRACLRDRWKLTPDGWACACEAGHA